TLFYHCREWIRPREPQPASTNGLPVLDACNVWRRCPAVFITHLDWLSDCYLRQHYSSAIPDVCSGEIIRGQYRRCVDDYAGSGALGGPRKKFLVFQPGSGKCGAGLDADLRTGIFQTQIGTVHTNCHRWSLDQRILPDTGGAVVLLDWQ